MSKQIKCLVWDLDNTIWNGTLAEAEPCRLRPGIRDVLRQLDSRGILMSIASANDYTPVATHLKKQNIWGYFTHPQINWDNKVHSLQTFARHLDIALDTMAFIDDEPFELAQVEKLLPEVRTYQAQDYRRLPQLPEFNPPFLTDESRRRRIMYAGAEARKQARLAAGGNRMDFLKWTQTRLDLREAEDNDIPRIMELLNRTSQLNATGVVYDISEIKEFVHAGRYRVYIAALKDRFVDYGIIGVAICRVDPPAWRLVSFLLSCRVLSRGISAIFLNWVRNTALRSGVNVMEVYYKKRPRNRKMYMLFKMNGFRYTGKSRGGVSIYSQTRSMRAEYPDWLSVNSEICDGTVSNTPC